MLCLQFIDESRLHSSKSSHFLPSEEQQGLYGKELHLCSQNTGYNGITV